MSLHFLYNISSQMSLHFLYNISSSEAGGGDVLVQGWTAKKIKELGWDWGVEGKKAKRVKPVALRIKTVQWMDYPVWLASSCPALEQKLASNGFGSKEREMATPTHHPAIAAISSKQSTLEVGEASHLHICQFHLK